MTGNGAVFSHARFFFDHRLGNAQHIASMVFKQAEVVTVPTASQETTHPTIATAPRQHIHGVAEARVGPKPLYSAVIPS